MATVSDDRTDAIRLALDQQVHTHTRPWAEAVAALDELVAERARLRAALQMIADRVYPATYVGERDGVQVYGTPDDLTRFALAALTTSTEGDPDGD